MKTKRKLKNYIKKLLRKLHLFKPVYKLYANLYLKRKDHFLNRDTPSRQQATFYKKFDRFVAWMERTKSTRSNQTILIYGYMVTPRKQLIFDISRNLIDKFPGARVVVMNNYQSTRQEKKILEWVCGKARVPSDVIFFPERSGEYDRSTSLKLELTEEMKQLLAEKPYLAQTVANARDTFPNALPNYLEVLMCEYYRCYEAVLNNTNVAVAVIWNTFKYHHYLFSEMCKERGVKIAYAEFGSLPGTFVFDTEGQMGESDPCVNYEQFNALPVTDEEYRLAEQVVHSLHESGLNRKPQPDNDEGEKLKGKLKPGRPIVLFAGQCDRDSGMIPYTEITQRYHSPSFQSSMEAMEFVAKVAEKYDWNYVFKPHPIVKHEVDETKLPSSVIYVKDININEIIDMSDVVVTILSSTVYVSLIRETPCLMLGYNQIHGKGCAYEALSRDTIEQELCRAVEEGYTQQQKEAFYRHIAQMNSYYLYCDGVEREPSYGQSVEKAQAFFEQFLSETPCTAAETAGRALFVCNSLSSLLSAVHVKQTALIGRTVDILLDSHAQWEAKCNLNELGHIFSGVYTWDRVPKLPEKGCGGEALAQWRTQCTDQFRSAVSGTYSDIYVSALNLEAQIAISSLQQSAPDLTVHLFEDHPQSFKSYTAVKNKLNSFKRGFPFEERKQMLDAVQELLLYQILKYERSSNDLILTPLGRYWWSERECVRSLLNTASSQELTVIQQALEANLPVSDVLEICRVIDKTISAAN